MAPQAYNIFNTHDHDISVCTIIYILLHVRDPHPEGINGDFQSDLANLLFNNRENLEYFHIRIIRLQHKINLSGETVSPTRLIFQ